MRFTSLYVDRFLITCLDPDLNSRVLTNLSIIVCSTGIILEANIVKVR